MALRPLPAEASCLPQVTQVAARELGARFGVLYVETSARDNQGLAEAFQLLAERAARRAVRAGRLREDVCRQQERLRQQSVRGEAERSCVAS